MSAYKKLNKQDAFITTYVAHKSWAITGSQFSSYNITSNRNVVGVNQNSLQQLYYPTKISGSVTSSAFDYYPQTTLYQSQSRELTTGAFLLSIPRELYGTAIKPESFKFTLTQNAYEIFLLVFPGYIADGYLQTFDSAGRKPPFGGWEPIPMISNVILDDGEGQLYVSGSSPRNYVGDIIYPHGMAIITDISVASFAASTLKHYSSTTYLDFKSSQPIFTHNYHCKLRESEFNFTYNPSALSSSLETVYDNIDEVYSTGYNVSTGELNNNITGSAFQPYITTVGLYNDANQLIAVGKVNRPVPKSANTEMTIIVKIDI
jgi:hypothetical protein